MAENNINNVNQESKGSNIGSKIWNCLKVLGGGVAILIAVLAKGGRKVEKVLPKIEEDIPKAGYVIDKEVRKNNQSNVENDSTASPSDY